MGISIRDVAVIFIPVPSVMSGTPDPAVPFEFVDTERFRKTSGKAEMDGFKNGLDGIGRNTVPTCYFRESNGFDKIQQNRVKEGLRHMKRRVDPVWSFIE